jgi:hypothetical protein
MRLKIKLILAAAPVLLQALYVQGMDINARTHKPSAEELPRCIAILIEK